MKKPLDFISNRFDENDYEQDDNFLEDFFDEQEE